MRTTTTQRAYVVAAKTDGGYTTAVQIRCPYCGGLHWHRWFSQDEYCVRRCCAGTPVGTYLVTLGPIPKEDHKVPEIYRTRADRHELVLTPDGQQPRLIPETTAAPDRRMSG
jgi:hypothetical protein